METDTAILNRGWNQAPLGHVHNWFFYSTLVNNVVIRRRQCKSCLNTETVRHETYYYEGNLGRDGSHKQFYFCAIKSLGLYARGKTFQQCYKSLVDQARKVLNLPGAQYSIDRTYKSCVFHLEVYLPRDMNYTEETVLPGGVNCQE